MQITKLQKTFFTINLDLKSSDLFIFYFFRKSNIAIYINHILNHFSFNIKNTKQTYFATWLFILKPFSKLIKNTKQIKRQFLPRTTRF